MSKHPGGILLPASYPKEMPHEHGKADGQGGRTQASVAPLIGHGEDADDELQGEEHLHGGGHSQADSWLQLKWTRHSNYPQPVYTRGAMEVQSGTLTVLRARFPLMLLGVTP